MLPRVSRAQIPEPVVPARFGADHFEAGDGAPELVGELQVCDVDHNTAKRPYAHVFALSYLIQNLVFFESAGVAIKLGFADCSWPTGAHRA